MPRRFIRHPASIPIQIEYSRPSEPNKPCSSTTIDVSVGGLCCYSTQCLAPGDKVQLKVVLSTETFKTLGQVVWCRRNDPGYLLGIGFSDMNTVYAVRMVEQACYIEEYRQKIKLEQGRELSMEEAALEWINIYAADFHQPDS